MQVKKVYKYATGVPIPESAIYLSTITEDVTEQECSTHCDNCHGSDKRTFIAKRLVWHYFLIEEYLDDDN